ncbi:hypothetical protein WA026_006687, partial [Henosepilachna vigintioctopunctata]
VTLNIDMNDVYSEIEEAKENSLKVKYTNDFGNKNASQKWQHTLKDTYNKLPNLLKIISFLLSIFATLPFTERICSVNDA